MAPRLAFVPDCEADIFISYAHDDDLEWIARFRADLQKQLALITPGRAGPLFWIDERLKPGDPFDPLIQQKLQKTAVMVAMVSPKFIASEYCIRSELSSFVRHHGSESGRVFQVWKTPLPDGRKPPLAKVQYLLFFRDGDPPEEFTLGDERYMHGVKLLARAILEKLNHLRRQATHIYVAWPSDSLLESDRTRIAEEFEGRHYVVNREVFDGVLTDSDTIRNEIGKAALSIHLFGRKSDEFAGLQLDLACETGKPVFVATRNPEFGGRGVDPASIVYLGDPNASAHLIQLVERASPAPGAAAAARNGEDHGLMSILVVFDDADSGCVYDLQERIPKRGPFRVYLPEFDLDPERLRTDCQNKLAQSRAVLICWGKAGSEWFQEKDNELTKMLVRWKGGSRPKKGKYLAPPFEGKDQIQTYAADHVIRTDEDLDRFLELVQQRVS